MWVLNYGIVWYCLPAYILSLFFAHLALVKEVNSQRFVIISFQTLSLAWSSVRHCQLSMYQDKRCCVCLEGLDWTWWRGNFNLSSTVPVAISTSSCAMYSLPTSLRTSFASLFISFASFFTFLSSFSFWTTSFARRTRRASNAFPGWAFELLARVCMRSGTFEWTMKGGFGSVVRRKLMSWRSEFNFTNHFILLILHF